MKRRNGFKYHTALLLSTALLMIGSGSALAADSGTNFQLYVPSQTTKADNIPDNNTSSTDKNSSVGTVPKQEMNSDDSPIQKERTTENKTNSRQTNTVKTDDKTGQLFIWTLIFISGSVITGGYVWLTGKKKFVKVRKDDEE